MLHEFFPRIYPRYITFPLLGPVLDDFAVWLARNGYRSSTIRVMLGSMARVGRWLREQGIEHPADLDEAVLESCWRAFHRRSNQIGGVVHALSRYLDSRGLLQLSPSEPVGPTAQRLSEYAAHLLEVRGFSAATIRNHVRTAKQFLEHIQYDTEPLRLVELTASDIESFLQYSGNRLERASLQQLVAHLRGFLRFLSVSAILAADLAENIDTPRIYRQEQLPHSLPWETVKALLKSIDQTTAVGLRDYTLLLIIAAYGLRVSEVAALTLDDIHWRERWLQVPCPKVGSAIRLPLTDVAASALLRYLREGRPRDARCRAVFLRSRAPLGPLTPTAVSMVFQRWASRSGLSIPFFGAHCLRHSYAVHLLRTGASFKIIGDLLGHRHADSTCGYLRLAVEDLRTVALPVPAEADSQQGAA